MLYFNTFTPLLTWFPVLCHTTRTISHNIAILSKVCFSLMNKQFVCERIQTSIENALCNIIY